MTALSAACVVAQALTGIPELVLYLTPLFLIAALLLSGHYVAEDRILARWRGDRPHSARRPEPRRRLPEAARVPWLLERSPLTRRGPPALLPHAV